MILYRFLYMLLVAAERGPLSQIGRIKDSHGGSTHVHKMLSATTGGRTNVADISMHWFWCLLSFHIYRLMKTTCNISDCPEYIENRPFSKINI